MLDQGTAPREPGLRHLGVSAATLVAARVVSAACALVQVPIALGALGPGWFGLWIGLTGLLWTFGSLDFGLGNALQNRIASLVATGREAEAASLLHDGRRWLRWVGVALAVAGVPLVRWGRWPEWLGVADTAGGLALTPALALVFAGAALHVPLSLAARVAAGVQRMEVTGLATAGGSVLSLGLVAVAAWQRWPFAAYVGISAVAFVAPHLATWWWLRRQLAWLRTSAPARGAAAGLVAESATFFALQLSATVTGAFTPMLVVLFAGPAAAAAYGVLQRLYSLATQVHSLALAPAWPAYTHADARGQAEFARRTFRATWVLTLAAFVGPTLALTPLVPALVRLWLGERAPMIEPALLWAVAGWHVLQFCGQPLAMVLNGVGRIAANTAAGWASVAVSLVLCAQLGPRWGASGVMLALAIPFALVNLPVSAWETRRILTAMPSTP
ncbi:MAG: hypothetical protein HZA93_15245 [Verrucomicrobia bacterium]|nr:hypothetical protein [Verrucomicrobiota bacterium]